MCITHEKGAQPFMNCAPACIHPVIDAALDIDSGDAFIP